MILRQAGLVLDQRHPQLGAIYLATLLTLENTFFIAFFVHTFEILPVLTFTLVLIQIVWSLDNLMLFMSGATNGEGCKERHRLYQ